MIGTQRERFRHLVESVAKVPTIWRRDGIPLFGPGPTVPGGAKPVFTLGPLQQIATDSDLNPKSMISLRVSHGQAVGYDDTLTDFDGTNLITRIAGVRSYNVEMRALSYSDALPAVEILELFRTRLFRPSVCKQLRALNISVALARDIIEIAVSNSKEAGREALLELKLNVGIVDLDTVSPTVGGGDWIAEAEVTEVDS